MTAHLHPDDPRIVICKPCGTEMYKPDRAVAMRAIADHNKNKHKEK